MYGDGDSTAVLRIDRNGPSFVEGRVFSVPRLVFSHFELTFDPKSYNLRIV